jgi:hypothetical protein
LPLLTLANSFESSTSLSKRFAFLFSFSNLVPDFCCFVSISQANHLHEIPSQPIAPCYRMCQ